jgi:hypothetical protein
MADLNKTVWMYWNRGLEGMPPLIRDIFESNRAVCARYGYEFELVTEANVQTYIPALHARFSSIAPNFQSDYVRYSVLHRYGGMWIDGDFIVYGDPHKLLMQLDRQDKDMLVAAEFASKIGCAFIAAKPASATTEIAVNYVNLVLDNIVSLYWDILGPDCMIHISKKCPDRLLVLPGAITERSMNIAGWQKRPGINTYCWHKETPEEARECADYIRTFDLPIIGTWTIYRECCEEVGRKLPGIVLKDPRSIFAQLLS